jgi:hypothetical protein
MVTEKGRGPGGRSWSRSPGPRRSPDRQLAGETPVGIEPTSARLQLAASPSGSSVVKECPRQESNLVPNLRRVVCHPPHPEDK